MKQKPFDDGSIFYTYDMVGFVLYLDKKRGGCQMSGDGGQNTIFDILIDTISDIISNAR